MPPRDRRLPETLLCRWLLVLLLGLGRAKAADLRPPCLVHPTQEAQPKAKRASKTVCFPLANVVQLMASELPEEAKISHNAKMWMQEMVSEMVFFVTSEAIDRSSLSGDRRVISSEDLNASLRSLGVPSSLPRSLAGFGRSRSLSALSSRCLSLSHALHLRVRRSRHSPRGVWQLPLARAPHHRARRRRRHLPPTRMSVPMAPRPPQLQGRPSAHAVPLHYAQRHPCDTVPEQYTVPSEPQFDPLPVSMPYQASLPAPPIPQQASMPMPMPHQAMPGPSGRAKSTR